MSTSDQQGSAPLTRKQLREIRRTGATPVTIPEASTPEPPASQEQAPPTPPPPAAQPREEGASDGAPLTRRQMRERERSRTESVPVVAPASPDAEDAIAPPHDEAVAPPRPGAATPPADEGAGAVASDAAIVSSVPGFVPRPEENGSRAQESESAHEPESAPEGDIDPRPTELPGSTEPAGHAPEDARLEPDSTTEPETSDDDALSPSEPADREETPESPDDRPVVNPAFGQAILAEQSDGRSFPPSFDELIASDSTGSQHVAPNTLIFTPAPGEGSLSGPVASTGEVLVTGSYELPAGLGSQGHADGTADGRDIDAVLIDGELPAASSPTPIAASAAVSTIKPAGEVIRPPAPDKGNRLMMTLAITAGGLALALAVALIIAFTTNVLG